MKTACILEASQIEIWNVILEIARYGVVCKSQNLCHGMKSMCVFNVPPIHEQLECHSKHNAVAHIL
jgi:hypothetical protein